MTMRRIVLAISLGVVFFSQPALPQVTTGTISGVVHDATGGVVPGASVTAKNVETGSVRTLTTGAEGRYQLPGLTVGKYEVQAVMPGFQTEIRTGIELTVGQEAVVNLMLRVGQVSERVEVAGEAPVVEATNAAITGLVDDKAIRELPLNGRSFDQLVLLNVGAIFARRDSAVSALGGGVKISISGTRPQQSSFLLDGTDINDARNTVPGGASGLSLGVDTVREFRVLTNAYSAEYGRSSGGVITAVTRSGTNNLHGSVFEFLRNSDLDARNFFDRDPSNPTVRSSPPPFKRNQFGFTLGGPIQKDKTFFFGSYEGLRDRLGVTQLISVPNALAHQGIIPQNGRVGAPLVNLGIAPGVQPWLNFFPLPNTPTDFGNGTGEYIYASSQPTNEDFFTVRVDHTLSSKHSLFGRYTFDNSSQNTPQVFPGHFLNSPVRNQYLTLQADSIFSPTTLNVVRFGLNRSVPAEENAYSNLPTGLTFVPGVAFTVGGELQAVGGGLTNIGRYDDPSGIAYSLFEWTDDLTRTLGRHTLKTGFILKRIRDNEIGDIGKAGYYIMNGGISDLLQGRASSFQLEWPGTTGNRGWRQDFAGFYAQDDFKMTSTLTLNLGVREEFMTSPTEVNGKCANVADVHQTTATLGCPFFNSFKNNWAPRVGFAWNARGNGRLVLRAGYGLFYDQPFSTYWRTAGRTVAPYTIQYTITNPPFPNAVSTLNLNTSPINSDIRSQAWTGTPYVMQYNFNLQSEVLPGMGVTLGYMASQGRKMIETGNMNLRIPVILPDGRKFFSLTAPFINPAWGQMRIQQTEGTSSYNALVVSVNQRFRGGFRIQGSYSYSKILSEGDRVFGRDFSGGELGLMDPYNPSLDRALAGYSLKHNFVFNYGYDLPFKRAGALGKVLGGWQINGITSVTSGAPFTAIAQCCSDNGGTGQSIIERPNLAPGHSDNPVSGVTAGCPGVRAGQKLGTPNLYFDPCAFVPSPHGFYGTVGRNTVIGPDLMTFDFSLVKNTSLTERTNLQFRAEFFNLLNHANFGTPANSVLNAQGNLVGNAGRITTTSTTARQIQFALKLVF